jgi:ribosome biogenesis GTPase
MIYSSSKMIATGLVIRGSKNIFTVCTGTAIMECRIKGKVLKDSENLHNPIAPGDRVVVETQDPSFDTGLILSVEERRNVFSRFNQKGGASQLLAANVDMVLCLTTPSSPPFRPRFLDRVLVQADAAGIEAAVICNKYDLADSDPDLEERLQDFSNIGYRVLRVSAKTGMGLDEFQSLIEGKTCVLTGQSGVGKSSLINALCPALDIRVGELNEKYDRGNHTTTMSFMATLPAAADRKETRLIDTPGLRRFIPDGIGAGDLILYFREFAPLAGRCSFGLSCSHRTEPGCKIMEAVHAGVIHEDRYESFLRIQDDLADKNSHD